ncbi:DUF3098 domain-containing protein [Spirosoma pomorum]
MAKDKQSGTATLTQPEPVTTTKTTTVTPSATRPVSTRPSSTLEAERRSASQTAALPFGRQNYTLMLIGIGVILAGFFIMSLDKEEFGFGFLGLTLGPIVVMSGFVLEFFAILARPKA